MVFELRIKDYKKRVLEDLYKYAINILVFTFLIGFFIFLRWGLVVSLISCFGIYLLLFCWGIIEAINNNKKIIEKIEFIDNKVIICFNSKGNLTISEYSIDEINMEYYHYIGKGAKFSLKIKKGYALFYEQTKYGGWKESDFENIAQKFEEYKNERKNKGYPSLS